MLLKIVFYLILALAFLAAPYYANPYVLSVLILVFYTAYVGQAWNLLLGYAGQLSFGHALYAGVGSYLAAGLFIQGGWSPWIVLFPIMAVVGLLGAIIGFLGFRFRVQGVYFTLLTIAFAECGRLIFEHLPQFGASAGLFLPLTPPGSLWYLRGGLTLFYYLFLGLLLIGLGISYTVVNSRLGYFSQAIRENEQSAQALGISTFWVKVMMMGLSASLTGAGGVLYAFYQNSLFPDQAFALSRSIELVIGAIVGGVSTLLGPILGSLVLIPLGEIISHGCGDDLPGIKTLFYGLSLFVIISYAPQGLWPLLQTKYKKRLAL